MPSVGWIASDPTWGNGYFNRIDYLRFNLNNGAWFFLPGASPPNNYVSEFPINPSPVTSDHSAYNYQYTITISILNSDIPPEPPFPVMMVIVTAAGAGVSIFIIILVKRRSGKKDTYYEY